MCNNYGFLLEIPKAMLST